MENKSLPFIALKLLLPFAEVQEVDRFQDLELELRHKGYSGIWKVFVLPRQLLSGCVEYKILYYTVMLDHHICMTISSITITITIVFLILVSNKNASP